MPRPTSSADAIAAPAVVLMPADDAFITRDQLIQLLDICSRTLYRWERAGKGPKRVKLGRSLFYRGSSVKEWIARSERDIATPSRRTQSHRVSGKINPRRR